MPPMPTPKPPAQPVLSNVPVTALRGVGSERAAQLARLKIQTVADLLLHRPRRYEDRRNLLRIADLKLGEAATAHGQVVALGLKLYAKGSKSVFELILDDGSGRLHCRWWNLPFMQNYFAQGDTVLVFGKVISLRPRTIDHPETEVIEANEESLIHLNRIAPVYPLTEGLSQRWLRSLMFHTLQEFGSQIAEPWPVVFSEFCERQFRAGEEKRTPAAFRSRAEAVRTLHFPEELAEIEMARERLALDEIIELQLAIQGRRKKLQTNAEGWPCAGDNRLIKPFLAGLGFKLTAAQTKVLREIRQDMRGGQPMRRLLQGDVGSGKTAVAACSALMALESGFSVALMAPTEILAEQHFQNFSRWFEPLGIPVRLRTGSHSAERSKVTGPRSKVERPVGWDSTGRAAPSAVLTVGTHALIEASFAQEKLGLVIIDEQHKFGVAQREALVRKGHYPHLLVMTATPIPRTLGLTLYGDLDISVIDELPAGRTPIKTFVRRADALPKVWAFIRGKLAEGRQAYVVYPRVEEGGKEGLKAVTKEWETLQQEMRPYRVGLLHGRQRADEKDEVMAAFRANSIKVLLTTPLIEVGVDVSNATIMLVENAERFGLAQLHQLRGRIGRGAHESYCILVHDRKTPEADRRLQILAETTDGFEIADADLKLRGPGELLGQQQSGLPPFRFANLAEDLDLVERARELAAWILARP